MAPLLDKIQDYRRNWMQHVNRIPRGKQITKDDTESADKKAGVRGEH
jgi:hypothetical protein